MQMQVRPCFNDLSLAGPVTAPIAVGLRCGPVLRHQERYRSKAADTFDAMISAACSDE